MYDTIVITFIDYKYIDIFNIFYDNFKKLHNLNLLVISLDEKTYNYLNEIGVNTSYEPYIIDNKTNFWEFRLKKINEIFKENKKNIIHTDADCFWFKNILEEIIKISDDYDIIGSIGFGHPKNIVDKLGFALCCGFYFIKYNYKNSRIIDKITIEKKMN